MPFGNVGYGLRNPGTDPHQRAFAKLEELSEAEKQVLTAAGGHPRGLQPCFRHASSDRGSTLQRRTGDNGICLE